MLKISLFSLITALICSCSVSPRKFLDAVQKGDEALVARYLEKGVDVNIFLPPDAYYADDVGRCQIPLSCAANRGYYSIAKMLLEQGADVNALNDNGVPPLFTAIYGKKSKLVKLLVENNADVNFISNNPKNRIKHSPLTLAVSNNDFLSFKILANSDVDLDYQNFYGYSAMSEAIKTSNLAAVNLLLNKNADIYLVDKTLCNYLCQSAKVNDTVFVSKFLQLGLPIEKPDFQGNTPLMIALLKKNPKPAAFLIKKGADVKVKDDMGNTTIQIAGRSGLHEVVKLLVEYGADSRFLKKPVAAPKKELELPAIPAPEAVQTDNLESPDAKMEKKSDPAPKPVRETPPAPAPVVQPDNKKDTNLKNNQNPDQKPKPETSSKVPDSDTSAAAKPSSEKLNANQPASKKTDSTATPGAKSKSPIRN